MRLLYVTGWCRSGSTILGNLLGEVPGVVHVGELYYLWRNGVLAAGTNTSCGCGEPVSGCPLWSAVIKRVAGDDPAALARRAIADQQAYLRIRHTRARLREATGDAATPAAVTTVLDRMVATYRAITEETGARMIVDSSKYPAEPAALLGRPEIDLRVLHLIRDPRATAYSWRRAKAYIPPMSASRSSGYWTASNLASERVGRAAPERYLRMRYEDFVADPAGSVSAVLRLCDLPDPPPVDAHGTAHLGPNHTVTGNPDRLVRGPVHIAPDDAWQRELPRVPALAATTMAAPLLHRYHYPYHR